MGLNIFERKILNTCRRYFLFFLLIISEFTYAQIQPSLEFTTGIAFPAGELGGELVSTNDSGISFISSDFLKNNYANSPGVTLTGLLIIPVSKSGTFSAIISGSYTYLNIFRSRILGTTILNNLVVPVTFDSRFSVSSAGFGIGFNPLPLSRFNPFINSSFNFSIISLTLNMNESSYALFNDSFRMGVTTSAGLSYKIDKEYSITIGGSYILGNLILKSSSDSYNDRAEFGLEGISLNDHEGYFYSNLSNPGKTAEQVKGVSKNIDWWTINIGLNIVLGKSNKNKSISK